MKYKSSDVSATDNEGHEDCMKDRVGVSLASYFPAFEHRLYSPSVMIPESSNYSSPKAQLTIFYSGMVYVYDNVPPDKAQGIMLLAQESSLLNSITMETPAAAADAHVTTPAVSNSSFSSICKLQGGIQLARNHTLKRFLEKRQARSQYYGSLKHDTNRNGS
ncbi:hypothetical protein NE237_018339 [Protea cynaroides]|uniref:Protein TIFY n=1 Tax=Protea cynaroides TaxID=273540 RepID=A0A9Q0QNU6_9MAGN|nr:hypothetical protein NE237_018339 [Protea cynaroides]